MTKNNPWELKNYDLEKDHEDYEMSRPYFFWVEYLRLSPSIELVHKDMFTKDGLNEKERQSCPVDFKNVISTYLNFKLEPILYKKMSFAQWWDRHGRDLFYMPVNKCKVQPIGFYSPMRSYGKIDLAKIEGNLKQVIKNERYSSHVVLSIPLSGDRRKILKEIDDLLTEEEFERHFLPRITNTLFHRLSGERTHITPLEVGLRMLYLKASEPKITNWRLGVKAGLSKRYSYLDADAIKLPAKDAEARRLMGIMTNRALKRAMLVMENAARGYFPSDQAVSIANIDFESLGKKLKLLNDESRKYTKYRP
jgi:hypothetical protein